MKNVAPFNYDKFLASGTIFSLLIINDRRSGIVTKLWDTINADDTNAETMYDEW